MDSTIYASRVGASPQQYTNNINQRNVQPAPRVDPAAQWADRVFGTQKYRGSAQSAPHNIYGGYEGPGGSGNAPLGVGGVNDASNIVHGANIQNDIPTGNEAPMQLTNPAQGEDTLPLQQASVGVVDTGMDYAPAGWKYDKPPEMPKDPTNGQKEYSPEAHQTGSAAITYGMQNNMPPAQSPVQAQTQAADHDKMQNDLTAVASAKNPKKAWEQVKKDPFYQNSDFYTGLMNVGLAIMSGANPMQAFQAGKGAMDKAMLSTQMGGNRQALIDQGYSPASVEAAITSGDTSKLEMQQMSDQDKLQAQDEQWAKAQNWQQAVNQQQTQQANNEWDRRNKITQEQAKATDERNFVQQKELEGIRQKTATALAQSKQDIKTEAGKAKNAQFGGMDQKAWSAATRPTVKRLETQSNRAGMYQQADAMLDNVESLVKAGKLKEAGDAMIQARESMGRGILGSNAMLDKERYTELTQMSDWLTNKINSGQMEAGFGPNAEVVSRMRGILDTDRSANEGLTKQNYNELYSSFRRGGMEPAEAEQATSAAFVQYPGFDADQYSADAEDYFGGVKGKKVTAGRKGALNTESSAPTSVGGFNF